MVKKVWKSVNIWRSNKAYGVQKACRFFWATLYAWTEPPPDVAAMVLYSCIPRRRRRLLKCISDNASTSAVLWRTACHTPIALYKPFSLPRPLVFNKIMLHWKDAVSGTPRSRGTLSTEKWTVQQIFHVSIFCFLVFHGWPSSVTSLLTVLNNFIKNRLTAKSEKLISDFGTKKHSRP